MFFRNLTLFRFAKDEASSFEDLNEALATRPLRAVGPLEFATRGFVSPLGPESNELVRALGTAMLFTIGQEQKLLPAAVINAEVGKRQRLEAEQRGRPVGGRRRREIKNEVLDTLLPQAFVRPGRLNAYIDLAGWVVIDTASRKAAEGCLTALREALGSVPALPLAPGEPPRALLTDWLAHQRLPDGFQFGDECELREPAGGAVMRCRRQELESGELAQHLRNGKQVFKLGLEFDGRVSFVLHEDLTIHKLRFLDVALDSLGDSESPKEELDARFALMSGELRRLLDRLSDVFNLADPST
jgi:recombination associated protein RdgC